MSEGLTYYLNLLLLAVVILMFVTGYIVPRSALQSTDEEYRSPLQRWKDRRAFRKLREEIQRDGFRLEDEE